MITHMGHFYHGKLRYLVQWIEHEGFEVKREYARNWTLAEHFLVDPDIGQEFKDKLRKTQEWVGRYR